MFTSLPRIKQVVPTVRRVSRFAFAEAKKGTVQREHPSPQREHPLTQREHPAPQREHPLTQREHPAPQRERVQLQGEEEDVPNEGG